MLKKLLIVLGIVAVVGVAAVGLLGWWAYRVFTGPIYVPGELATSTRLAPPAAEGDAWIVENGIELHHFARGDGPPVLFVHGGPGAPVREPMPWLDGLASSFRVHFYDQRGCGDSTRPFDAFPAGNWYGNMTELEETLGLGAQIADIERIRRLLDAERLVLVGHSFGGFLAALYAAEFPDRVEKLVLLAPANMLVMPHEGEDLFTLVRARLPVDTHPEYDALLAEYLDFQSLFEHDEASLARLNRRLADFILAAMGRDPLPVLAPDALPENGGWMVHAMYLSGGRRHDYTPALAAIRAPTLVVHADDDLQDVTASAQYVDAIAGAELHRVPGADHFFDTDLPALRERVAAFLQPAPGASPRADDADGDDR